MGYELLRVWIIRGGRGSAEGRGKKVVIKISNLASLGRSLLKKSIYCLFATEGFHHAARATDEKAAGVWWVSDGVWSVCVFVVVDDGVYGCAILWRRTCQMFRAVRKFTF